MAIPSNYGGLPIGFFIQQPIPVDWRFVFDNKTDLNSFLSGSLSSYSSYLYEGLHTYVKSTEHYYKILQDDSNNWIYEVIPKIWLSASEPDSSKVEVGDIWVQP